MLNNFTIQAPPPIPPPPPPTTPSTAKIFELIFIYTQADEQVVGPWTGPHSHILLTGEGGGGGGPSEGQYLPKRKNDTTTRTYPEMAADRWGGFRALPGVVRVVGSNSLK